MAHPTELRARADQYFTYSGRSLLVSNLDGQVAGQGIEGFYVDNTRLLSREEWTADGRHLRTVAASPVEGSGFLAYAEVPGAPGVPPQRVYVEIARFLGEGMQTEIRIENYSAHSTAHVDLRARFAADFADIIEATEGRRQQTAEVKAEWDEARRELCFRYLHPSLDRAVAVRVDRSPVSVRFDGQTLSFPLELRPHEPVRLSLSVEPIFDGVRRAMERRTFAAAGAPLERLRRRLRDDAPVLATTNPTVAGAWETAVHDLASLPLGLPEGLATPIAGLPLYQEFFGRDTLTIAWQALLAMPEMLRDTLKANAQWQGRVIDDWLDEEPGKLIHQARWGPLSVLGLNPLSRYYGDWATPPDFLIMLGQYFAWTNDLETVRGLLPAARRTLEWIERYGDLDGDGFLEYETRSERGLKNQGWKDSGDGIVDERGETVPNPIATCEIQAYWYAGLEQVAYAFAAAGDAAYALELRRKAAELKRRFDKAFWMDDLGFYAMALGPDKRPVRSIGSNAGHLLGAGIVPKAKARRVARRLMQPDLFSGWAIRTLSSEHAAYNPFSYHLGSVWPAENGTFALGFARYGLWPELHRLTEGLFSATDLFVANRLPEALGGLPRDEMHPHPGIYPNSNEPQGWSASTIVMLVQSLLGLRPVAPLGLLLIDPHLPPWLPDLRLQGIRVGAGRVDLRCWRTERGETRCQVVARDGPIRVLRQPTPNAPNAHLVGRAAAVLRSVPLLVRQE